MSTTTTTNLSLIKENGDEYVKTHRAHANSNLDAIDMAVGNRLNMAARGAFTNAMLATQLAPGSFMYAGAGSTLSAGPSEIAALSTDVFLLVDVYAPYYASGAQNATDWVIQMVTEPATGCEWSRQTRDGGTTWTSWMRIGVGNVLPVANGGTGAATAALARTSLDAAQDGSSGVTLADTATSLATTIARAGVADADWTTGEASLHSQIVTLQDSVSYAYYDGQSLITLLGASGFDDCVSKLHTKAQSRDGSGVHIGDYIDVTPTDSKVNRGSAIRYRLAGIGHNYRFGDSECPWAFWFVPDDGIDMTGNSYAINTSYIYWNTTANNNGTSAQPAPYLASNLHAWELNSFLPALPTSLKNVLVNHRILFEQRFKSGSTLTDSTGWGWGDAGKVFSLSETEVYGQCVWGTKGYSVGCDAQLPLFRVWSHNRLRSRVDRWLRTVHSGSSTHASGVSGSGHATYLSTTNTWIRPWPCFLLG